MSAAELLTREPVGSGSRFRAEMRMLGRPAVEMTVELTEFERPRRLGSRTESLRPGRRGRPTMVTEGTLTFEPASGATRMRWSWQVRMPGALGLASPLVAWLGRRQERRIWSSLKELLESGDGEADVSPPAASGTRTGSNDRRSP